MQSETSLNPESREREILQLARQLEGLKRNPAWETLLAALEKYRDSALDDIRGCRSSNDKLRSHLLYRWEERDKFLRFIHGYIENIAQARLEVIRAIAEANGSTGEQTEDLIVALEAH